jgi:hypothetical protein
MLGQSPHLTEQQDKELVVVEPPLAQFAKRNCLEAER